MKHIVRLVLVMHFLVAGTAGWLPAADWTLSEMVGRDEQGRPVYRGRPLEKRFTNP